jgi:hypothetical protein
MVKDFFVATVAGGLGNSSPAKKKGWEKEGPWLGMGSNCTGPLFVEVVWSGSSATAMATIVMSMINHWVKITLTPIRVPLLKTKSVAPLMMLSKSKEGLLEKRKMKSLLWVWKGQLVKAKQKVNKAWQMVLEGLEVLHCYPALGWPASLFLLRGLKK